MTSIINSMEPTVAQLICNSLKIPHIVINERTWLGLFEALNEATHRVGDPAFYPRLQPGKLLIQ